jgi:formate hydrogenlyase subunit 4
MLQVPSKHEMVLITHPIYVCACVCACVCVQVKIAELPVDVFRMMQTLEWSNPALELHGRDEDGGIGAPLASGAC